MYIMKTQTAKGLMIYKPKHAIHREIQAERAEPIAEISASTTTGASTDMSMLGSGLKGISNKKIVSALHDTKSAKNKFSKFISLKL